MTPGSHLPFGDPDGASGPGDQHLPGRRVLTVSTLTALLREAIEEAFFEVWVDGEISNCRVYGGHYYFTLKDEGAQLRVVLFQSAARRLRTTPADGERVIARGRLTVYDRRGEYQLVCDHLEPRGLGALQATFERLRRRLEHEGLFDDRRKRPLPALPRRIGIVTSVESAALRDILRVLYRRVPNASVVIADARVQGDEAPSSIARALGALATVAGVDVIILARGGGSLEDLWAFNEEVVARAIAAAPVPVVTGIGHQTDFTIADFVADVRAATPSNAAELVCRPTRDVLADVDRLRRRAAAAVRRQLAHWRDRVHRAELRAGLGRVPVRLVNGRRDLTELLARARMVITNACAARARRLQALETRLDVAAPARRLARLATRLGRAETRLSAAARQHAQLVRTRLGTALARLEALSPLAVLARGYAVCWDAARTRALREADPALTGTTVHVRLARGELACTVTGVTPSPPPLPRAAATPPGPSPDWRTSP